MRSKWTGEGYDSQLEREMRGGSGKAEAEEEE
jgi:hypothetical protein